MTERLGDAVRAAYGDGADAWLAGPARVYDRLAETVVAALPVALTGERVLDIGAGTGAVARAVRAVGGLPVALDTAAEMTRLTHRDGLRSVQGDAARLPFRSGAFAAAVAAFSFTHVPELVTAVREAARVVVDDGAVVAAASPTRRRAPSNGPSMTPPA